MIKAKNPIFYSHKEQVDQVTGEVYEPGWYFWDETWAYRHGPFSSYKECAAALQHYCEAL